MQYQSSVVTKSELNAFSMQSLFIGKSSKNITPFNKIFICSIKKHHPSLSLPRVDGVIALVFWKKTDLLSMFFHDPTGPTSIFNINKGNQCMSKTKIVELQVGEYMAITNSTVVKFLSGKSEESVRLAINAPQHVRIYTEESRQKYLENAKEEEGNEAC